MRVEVFFLVIITINVFIGNMAQRERQHQILDELRLVNQTLKIAG